MTKRNEWDNERHDERVPDKMITTRTSWNSKRTPTGGQKPTERVGWRMTRQTHSPAMTTWTSQNSKRTPIGGHKPLEWAGWQTTRREPPQEGKNLQNEWDDEQCDEHVPQWWQLGPPGTRREPPLEGMNLWNEWDNKQGPDVTRTLTEGHKPLERAGWQMCSPMRWWWSRLPGDIPRMQQRSMEPEI